MKPLPIVTVVKTVVGHYVSLRFFSCFVIGDTVTEDLHVDTQTLTKSVTVTSTV